MDRACAGGRNWGTMKAVKPWIQAGMVAGWLWAAGLGWALEPAVLSGDTATLPLWSHVEILRDPAKALSVDDVRSAEFAVQFERNTSERIHFGYTDDVIWVRVCLRSELPEASQWYVVLAHTRFEYVDWFVFRGDALAGHFQDGMMRPRDPAAAYGRHPARTLDLAPGETVEVVLRLQTQTVVRIPLAVYSRGGYLSRIGQEGTLYSFCLGAFGMLFFTGLFFAVLTRERGYLAYSIGVVLVFLLFFGLSGYWHLLQWPGWRYGPLNGVVVFNALGVIAILTYARWFFDLPATMPKTDRFLRGVRILFGLGAIWALRGPFLPRYLMVQIFDVVTGGTAIAVAVVAWRNGNRTARFYLLAWLSFWVLLMVEFLQQWAVLPVWGTPDALPLLGLLAGFTLFQLAMADRVRQVRQEKDAAQARAEERTLVAREREEAQRLAHVGSWSHELAADKIEWSDEIFRIFGLEPGRPPASFEELKSLLDVDSFAKVAAAVERCVATGEPYQENLTLRRPNGDIRHVVARGERVPGEPVRLRGTLSDVTEMRRIEEAMRARQDELEQAIHTAEQASRAKSLFMANISHEIRTPLSALVGLSQAMVKQSERRGLPEDFTRMLQQIRSGGRHLNLMLTNLLDLSAAETMRMRLKRQPVGLAEWSRSVRDILEPIADARPVELHWRDESLAGTEIESDPVRLSQILINLVHNAVKFTPVGKAVEVRLERSPGRFVLEVADEGPGLPADGPMSFEAFGDQADGVAGTEHGVGLGLFVVQTSVNLLGGRIHAANRPGGGASFRVEWTFQEEDNGHARSHY